jgi:hypothetical protein
MADWARKLVAGWIREKAAALRRQAQNNAANGYTKGPMAQVVPRAAEAYKEAANLLDARASELEDTELMSERDDARRAKLRRLIADEEWAEPEDTDDA